MNTTYASRSNAAAQGRTHLPSRVPEQGQQVRPQLLQQLGPLGERGQYPVQQKPPRLLHVLFRPEHEVVPGQGGRNCVPHHVRGRIRQDAVKSAI